MFDWRNGGEWARLFRYYQTGIVNAAFGFGLYSLLVWVGMDMYLAQLVAHVVGVAFNFLTYSRYAFADMVGSKLRFVLSYGVNYLLSVATLWAFSQITASPYLAGFLSIFVVSLINFFILKRMVFSSAEAT